MNIKLEQLLSAETVKTVKELLGEELAAQLDGKLKNFEIDTGREMLIPKNVYDSEREKTKGYAEQLAERDKQIEALQKSAGDSDTIKEELKRLQESNAQTKSDFENKLKAAERAYALKDVLKNTYKARDTESVMPHLNNETILFSDGKFTGLDEQIKALQKDKSYLFDIAPAQGSGGAPQNGGTFSHDVLNALSDKEYYEATFKKN